MHALANPARFLRIEEVDAAALRERHRLHLERRVQREKNAAADDALERRRLADGEAARQVFA